MKSIKKALFTMIAKSAYGTAKTEADSACFCFAYQPELPKKVRELSRRK